MIRTPEEQYLHDFVESYVAPLRKELAELRKELAEQQRKNQSKQLVCGRDIKFCAFYDKGKCKNNEYPCKDQVEKINCH